MVPENDEQKSPYAQRTAEGTTSPQPEVFVCSTAEQFLTHLDLRARSPQLRHVPIIQLPDQESDEV